MLDGPQVVHLLAGTKVGGQKLAVASRTFEHRVGPHAGVVAAKGHRHRAQGGVPADPAHLVPKLPSPSTQQLDLPETEPRPSAER